MVQMEARRKGQSVTRYEEEGDLVEQAAASKPKAKFTTRFSKLFGGGAKSASASPKHLHHEYGKVRCVDAVFSVCFIYSCVYRNKKLSYRKETV